MTVTRISSGSAWEEKMSYSRAVVCDGVVHVSGCSGLPSGDAPDGDAATQFARAAEKVARFLGEAGAGLADVVVTRTYLTDPADWDALVEAHGLAFAGIRPAASMVQVARLIDPRMRVELEVTARLPR